MSFIRVLKVTEYATQPRRATPCAAGYDLHSCEDKVIQAKGRGIVNTGIAISIPDRTYARVAPRSGLTVKNGIDVGAGVIDQDYRGEIKVVLFNHSNEDFVVKIGDRIAQLIIEKIETPDILMVDSLDETERGDGGFGSTGK